MDSEAFSSASYSTQLHGSSMHTATDDLSHRRFASDGSTYSTRSSTTLFDSSSYMSPLRHNPEVYDTSQDTYPHIIYPESSQRTATALAASSMGPTRDSGNFSRLSSFTSNHGHYDSDFDYDTPHMSGTASGNGSLFDRYGASSMRNGPGAADDHRSPSLVPMLSGAPDAGPSHSSTTSTTSPFYSPLSSHAMTSYSGESSSSNASPASRFKLAPTSKLVNGPGFDMPSPLEGLNYGHDHSAQNQGTHLQQRRTASMQQPTKVPPLLKGSSIPMSKAAADQWIRKLSGSTIKGPRTTAAESYHSSPSSSSSTTPTLAAATLMGARVSANRSAGTNTATTATSIGLSQPPYGSDRRSLSSTPPLDIADLGSRSESLSVRVGHTSDRKEHVLTAPPPTSSSKHSATLRLEDETAGQKQEPVDQQPPLKKKKKSKMHSCEICSKKFPRPSGLRTHMNTHNNARPYACGFPGCTRTFGVRSNAKRHLRTHGVIPPPTTAHHNNSDPPYVVGFSPPVVAHSNAPFSGDVDHSGIRAAALSLSSLSGRGGLEDANSGIGSKHGLARAPFFKLRWMPPSLTSRTNAGKLRPVDEATGEVSEDEMDGAEDGDEDGNKSDYDSEGDNGGGGSGGQGGFGGGDPAKQISMLSSLGNISLPTLVSLGGGGGGGAASSSNAGPSETHGMNSSRSSGPYSISPSHGTARHSCICPFSTCISTPCRSVGHMGTSSSSASYSSPSAVMDHTVSMGGFTRSMTDLGVGLGEAINSLGISSSSSFGMGGSGLSGYLSMGHSGGNSLYGAGIGVGVAHQPHHQHHLLVSA